MSTGEVGVETAAGLGQSLAQALRYVGAWKDKTVVVKYGGSVLAARDGKNGNGVAGTVIQDLVLLKQAGVHPILVHGGGPEITRLLQRLGKESRFVNGLRVTDEETMEVVEMVLAGRANKALVGLVAQHGGRAVGLSGKDGQLFQARQLSAELGLVGEIAAVNPHLITSLSREGFLPVVASIGIGPQGESYNLNADTAAGALAVATTASKFILLTDTPGIYRDHGGSRTFISQLRAEEARLLITEGVVSAGMVPKIEACLHALGGGVPSAHIIDGRQPHALLVELFTEAGIGTMIVS